MTLKECIPYHNRENKISFKKYSLTVTYHLTVETMIDTPIHNKFKGFTMFGDIDLYYDNKK